ncbi:MAG TPA: class I SAM-dependent methyltransferase [Candidatus Binataceae bacterium]|nr:class I SAM-dependent methyltransferase [Candidatus Binataceae bacterium]
MIRHRYLILLLAAIVWATAIVVYLLGKKWLLFGAGVAALVIGIHMVLVVFAFVLGGASLVGFLLRSVHAHPNETPGSDSKLIHWARSYDLLVWVLTLGRDRVFREKTLDLAQLAVGESVLDIGCGTGTLAIAAKRRVGSSASVTGIDASPHMIARARKKARSVGADVTFATADVERLPYAAGTFDVVLSTVMLHHLSDDARLKCIGEVRRVLKPGGRFLALDFGGAAAERCTRAGRMHNHAHFNLLQLVPQLRAAGLSPLESGPAGFRDLQFVRAVLA